MFVCFGPCLIKRCVQFDQDDILIHGTYSVPRAKKTQFRHSKPKVGPFFTAPRLRPKWHPCSASARFSKFSTPKLSLMKKMRRTQTPFCFKVCTKLYYRSQYSFSELSGMNCPISTTHLQKQQHTASVMNRQIKNLQLIQPL